MNIVGRTTRIPKECSFLTSSACCCVRVLLQMKRAAVFLGMCVRKRAAYEMTRGTMTQRVLQGTTCSVANGRDKYGTLFVGVVRGSSEKARERNQETRCISVC